MRNARLLGIRHPKLIVDIHMPKHRRLDDIVRTKLCININENMAKYLLKIVSVSYHSPLRRHCISSILHENQKVTVYRVISIIRHVSIPTPLKTNLHFAHCELRKDMKAFMEDATNLAEAFELIENGIRKNGDA